MCNRVDELLSTMTKQELAERVVELEARQPPRDAITITIPGADIRGVIDEQFEAQFIPALTRALADRRKVYSGGTV